jgi:hypothetical protein
MRMLAVLERDTLLSASGVEWMAGCEQLGSSAWRKLKNPYQ